MLQVFNSRYWQILTCRKVICATVPSCVTMRKSALRISQVLFSDLFSAALSYVTPSSSFNNELACLCSAPDFKTRFAFPQLFRRKNTEKLLCKDLWKCEPRVNENITWQSSYYRTCFSDAVKHMSGKTISAKWMDNQRNDPTLTLKTWDEIQC